MHTWYRTIPSCERHKKISLGTPFLFPSINAEESKMDDHLSRKRPRSSSPVLTTSTVAKSNELSRGQLLAAQLNEPSKRNEALNELMKLTAAPELSYSLDGEEILVALVDIFFDALGWQGRRPAYARSKPVFSSMNAWTRHVTPENEEWASFCSMQLAKGKLGINTLKLLEVVLLIMRNLSFVASNHRLMAYSPDVLNVLVGAL